MSLVGNISLTNNENGLYLGKVNIDNLNVSADQLLYSTDGVNISGLNLGNGLEKVIDELKTIGNPDIQLTTHSIYVNENISTIQSAVDSATAPDTIYISSGSYNETVNITNKTNIALINNSANISTICEILNGLNITGTSENIRLSNLSIKGSTCLLNGVGRNVYSNCVFTGTVSTPLNITIGDGTSQYMTFSNCGFNQYCNITVPLTFTNVIYFIDCNWGGASLTLNQQLAQQVIINNTANLVSFPAKATYVGINVLSTGVINSTTTNINNSGKITAGESLSYVSASPIGVETAHNENNFFTGILAQNKDSSDGSSTHLLITNNQGTDFSHYGGFDMFSSNSTIQYGQFGTMPNALGISSQSSSIVLTPNAGNSEDSAQNNNIILCYDNGTKALIINDNGQLIVGADNPSFAGNTYGGDDGGVNNVLTSDGVQGLKWTPIGGVYSSYTNFFLSGQQTVKPAASSIVLLEGTDLSNKLPIYPTIVDCVFNFTVSAGSSDLTITYYNDKEATSQSYIQSISRNGHHIFPVKFQINGDSQYLYSFRIVAEVSAGNISTDVKDFYSVEFRQIKYP